MRPRKPPTRIGREAGALSDSARGTCGSLGSSASPEPGASRSVWVRLGRWLLPPLTDDAPEPAAKTFAGKARGIWDRYLWSAHETPARRAAAVGVGVFCSIFPVWGAQMLLALLLARVLRLNRVLTLAASNFSLPPMIPLIVYAALMTGQLALTGRWTWVIPFGGLTAAAMRKYFLEFIVGSSLLAAGAGLLAWAASYAVLRWVLRPGAKP